MQHFKIITDSSCDISDELVKQFDIAVIPYYVTIDGVTYLKEKIDITLDEFFEYIKPRSVFPKTSLPTISDYLDVFRKHLEQDLDILCFCLTAKFSGSYQSAINAKNILSEEFPGRKIFVIDSTQATFAQGLLVLEAAKLQQAGVSIEKIVQLTELEKDKARIFVTTATLDYLQRGGRIGKSAALAGTLLNIKPVLCLKEGELFPVGKFRGMKRTIQELLDLTMKELPGKPQDYTFAITYASLLDEAKELEQMFMERYNIKMDYPFCRLGITIGAHIGGEVLGIMYARKISDMR